MLQLQTGSGGAISHVCCWLQTYMFPNQDHGHLSVLEDGTLLVTSVRMDDVGVYLCKGLSIAGTAVAKVRLDVQGKRLLCCD